MDRKTLNILLASILTTLDETNGGWSPRTMIMLGCKLDLATYTFVESILVDAKLCTKTSEVITISDKGREMAKKISAAVKG